jgi:hypothetical protein
VLHDIEETNRGSNTAPKSRVGRRGTDDWPKSALEGAASAVNAWLDNDHFEARAEKRLGYDAITTADVENSTTGIEAAEQFDDASVSVSEPERTVLYLAALPVPVIRI